MNKVKIFSILENWNFWKNSWDEGIPRPFYLEKISQLVDSGQVLFITGVRRSGKSFLMRQTVSFLNKRGVAKKNILFVNFEDPRWIKRDVDLLNNIFETYKEFLQPDEKPYLFLDEIQEVEGWERWVRMMHELNKATLIVSGSNADLLGRELGTALTGRHVNLNVYPLSFSEFIDFKGIENRFDSHLELQMRGFFREYFAKGSFPALFFLEEKSPEWFLAYYEDILEKDLVSRFRIRKIEQLKALLDFYMSNISKISTFNSVGKFLKISPDTAAKFTTYFEQSFLIFSLKRFSRSFKEKEKSPRKIYSIDVALSQAIGFRTSDDEGRIMENIVFLEYLRRKNINPKQELFYWKEEQRGRDGKEVDFVVKEGAEITEAVQVCFGELTENVKKRELGSIVKMLNYLKPKKILIITEEFEGREKHDFGEVIFVPLWKWLLE